MTNRVWHCGVQVELKPSAENLVDGDERNILGLIWCAATTHSNVTSADVSFSRRGVMRTFLKFDTGDDGPDGQKMSAVDALKMWVRIQTAGYKVCLLSNALSEARN